MPDPTATQTATGVEADVSRSVSRDGRENLIPADRGNSRAVTHGGHATLALAPRAGELAADLRAVVPVRTDADETTIRLLALVLARIEAANEYLAEHGILTGKGQPRPVLKVLSTWENTAARLADQLGLTPTSRAKLGLNLTRAAGANLDEHLRTRYPDREAGS